MLILGQKAYFLGPTTELILANKQSWIYEFWIFLFTLFRIDFTDVSIIPDVTKKAESSTKAEFEEIISGCDIPIQELKHNLERTNRYLSEKNLLNK